MARDISGVRVYDGLDEILAQGNDYAVNYVKIKNPNLNAKQMKNLIDGNGGYVVMDSKEARRRARRAQMAARRYAMLARRADVKDDEGDHDDHEWMHIDHYGDKWIVTGSGLSEKKFDNQKDACDYILSIHDNGDERVEKEERLRRARRIRAMRAMRARRARASVVRGRAARRHVVPASRRIGATRSITRRSASVNPVAPRISATASDPMLKGIIK